MEVFPWARWGGNDNLPPFAVDQTFMPTELLLKEVVVPQLVPPCVIPGTRQKLSLHELGGPAHQQGH